MDCSDSEGEVEVELAEWVSNRKPIACPFGKKEPEKFGFDISKADKIFDLLLQQGQITLSQHHTIPTAEELKKIRYCKWHNATSHSTNDCKVFCQQIQTAIDQGKLKFEAPAKPEKPMKIDQHPFSTNMVKVFGKNALQTKLLTSKLAKNKGTIDPKVQVTTDDIKGKKLLEEGENSKAPRHPITSQMLLSKFQC